MGTAEARRLTRRERIEARHWLQVLAEHARSVRNAMDPVAGLPTITAGAWDGQWAALRADLDAFTSRVRLNRPSPGGISDRNAGPDDEEAAGLLTWEADRATFRGLAGGTELFVISWHTQRGAPKWLMRSSLPGLYDTWRDDDETELQRVAERELAAWLARVTGWTS